jgi:hypothetical protein
LTNSSYVKAEFSIEQSTQCYAIGAVYGVALKTSTDLLREKLEEMTKDEQENFKKTDSEIPKTLSFVIKFTNDIRKLGVSRLVKNGKTISEANSFFESKSEAFKDKQLMFDKKISPGQYYQTLEDLFNDCLGKFKKELRKDY